MAAPVPADRAAAGPASGTWRIPLPLWLFVTAGAVYLVDRASKVVVERTLAGRPDIEVIPGVLHLNFTENPGGAFSLFGGQPWLFFAASLVVSVAIVAASTRLRSASSAVALGMILGGAVGNLTDRLVRGDGISGKVVDFIDFQIWPVFNVADSAIVIGALLMVLVSLRREDGDRGLDHAQG